MLSLITPTADRPVAFDLCERWMRRQTIQPDEWIVADGGGMPVICTMGQMHIHRPAPPGAANFANNLLNALAVVKGEAIIFIEDDDWYAPDHLETLAKRLRTHGLAGHNRQQYYNIEHRRHRTFNNVGASLCQTGMQRSMMPTLEKTIHECMAKHSYGIDTTFWRAVPGRHWGLLGRATSIGIKGIPGLAGLGVGHRPTGDAWEPDPDLAKLREWTGEDSEVYATLCIGGDLPNPGFSRSST